MTIRTLFGSLLAMFGLAAAQAEPAEGQPAPAFRLADQNGASHSLADYSGRWLVLYFYPKDDTPGCTKEACNFRDDIHGLRRLDAEVLGVSVDTTDSHARFAEKYKLPFPLLADTDGEVARAYGALRSFGPFKMAKRQTFIIDPRGRLAKVYRSVSPARHSGEVIADLEALQAR